ncbi:MAG: hypothetical protein WC889_20550, partial [Myxococcota bacterium]
MTTRLIAAIAIAATVAAALSCTETKKTPVNPSDYPAIDDIELGQLRWMLKLGAQPVDDFANFDSENQGGLSAYRYAIAFGVYFLAAEQYHKLPAWTDAIRPAMDTLSRKLLEKKVWEYWAQTSRGIPNLEPTMDQPYPESHDPVGEKNIMYSGHVGQVINLFQMLYRDKKWDLPGSITYRWDDSESHIYDNASLIEVMRAQMQDNTWHGICCEPNAIFPECNQHPVLAFLLYDKTHGTKVYDGASPLYFDFFQNAGF